MLKFKEFINKERKIPVMFIGINDDSDDNLNETTVPLPILHRELQDESQLTQEEKAEVGKYKKSSKQVNAYLIGRHYTNEQPVDNYVAKPADDREPIRYHLPTLDSALNKPIGRHLTVFSGVGFDPRAQMSPEGLLHLPAYTSTSISGGVANKYAERARRNNGYTPTNHVFQIDLNPDDKGAYVQFQRGSIRDGQIILPRGTTLKITHSTEDLDDDDGVYRTPIVVHHAKIVHNVNPNDIDRDTTDLFFMHPSFLHEFNTSEESSQKLKDIIANPNLDKIERRLKTGKHQVHELLNLFSNVPHLITHQGAKNQFSDSFVREMSKHREQPIAVNSVLTSAEHSVESKDFLKNLLNQVIIKNVDKNSYFGSEAEREVGLPWSALRGGYIDNRAIATSKNSLIKKITEGYLPEFHLNHAKASGYYDDDVVNALHNSLINKLKSGNIDQRHIQHAKDEGYYDNNVLNALHEGKKKKTNDMFNTINTGRYNLYQVINQINERPQHKEDVKEILRNKFANFTHTDNDIELAQNLFPDLLTDDLRREMSKRLLDKIHSGTSTDEDIETGRKGRYRTLRMEILHNRNKISDPVERAKLDDLIDSLPKREFDQTF